MNINMQVHPLTNDNIQICIDSLQAFSSGISVSRKRVTWMLLTLEELLLKYRDYGGSQCEFRYRYRVHYGLLMIEVSVRGGSLNDILSDDEKNTDDDDIPEILRNLLNELYGDIRFRSRNDWEYINISLPLEASKHLLPGSPVIYAVLLGVILGGAFKYLAPRVALPLLENIVTPLYSLILNLVRGGTEAYVFVSLIAAISKLSDRRVFKKNGRRMLIFFFSCTLLLFLLCVAVCIPVFQTSGANQTDLNMATILSSLLDSVPTSFITPFVERNMIQIVLLGIIFGVVLQSVNDKMGSILLLVDDLKFCFTIILQYLMKAVPLLVFLSIVKIIMSVEIPELARIWKIIAIDQGLDLLVFACSLAFVSVKYKISLTALYGKISPALHVAVSTGSTTAAIPELYDIIHPKLGVDESFANYWIPLSSTIFSPSIIFPLTIFAFFAAESQGVAINVSWIITLFIMILVMGIASPRVPGGIVATVAIILSQLGMNSDQLALFMSANIIILYLDAALAIALRTMASVVLSDRQKLCDLNVLRK